MLLRSLVACSVALACCTANANEYQIEKLAAPSFQQVSLTLDPSQDRFSGETRIELEILKATHEIELSGRDYALQAAKLVGQKECDLGNKMLETGKVRLRCDEQLSPGKYTLTMKFDAPFNRQSVGLYKTVDRGLPYLFTQFEMSDARRAFPVFDEPSYKIPFQLTITAPDDQKVYANTPEIKTTRTDGMTTHFFDKTPPIPSYLVAMAVGPFEEKEIKGMPIPGRILTPQGKVALAEYQAAEMPAILAALEDYFGIPYVYKKLDSVGVPEFPFGAMENAGLITYREDILLLDQATATRGVKQSSVSVVAHELAHQWYGNLVTMKWWNDLWLNEAFASWMAAKVTKKLHPEFESALDLPQNHVMSIDARLSTKPIRKPINSEADIMDGLGLAYSKGSAVLSMVENWIGEEAFQQGIRNYMKKFAYKNAEAADLWQALGEASGKDVAGVLKSYIEQSSFPLLSVSQQGNKLTIKQQRFVNAGVEAPAQLWNVPVSIKYGKGDRIETHTILLDKASTTITLDFTPDWIYPDQGALGYYRWSMPQKEFDALLGNAPSKLNDRERLALLSATDALLHAGVISAPQLMQTLQTFVADKHPKVATLALEYLVNQKETFETEKNQHNWRSFIANVVRPATDKYGLTAQPGEAVSVAQLRAELLERLGIDAADKAIIKKAKQEAKRYLESPEKVDPYLATTYLKIAAYYGDKSLLAAYQQAFSTATNPQMRTKLLYAMGFFGSAEMQTEVMNYSLGDTVTASDMRYLLWGWSYGKSRAKVLQNWVFENYGVLVKKLPPFVVPSLPTYTSGSCDASDLAKSEAFYQAKLAEQPGFKRSLSKVKESTSDCLNLKQRELAKVDSYLSKL